MKKREWSSRVIHFIVLLSLCLAIIAAPTATIKAASSAEYTASEIQSWLINQVESTTVPYTTPTVDMGTLHKMRIDASMTILGTSIALNHVVFTFDGTTTVKIKGELSLLGKSPRFGQGGNDIECTVECQAGGAPHLTNISNINVADYWPSLSASELGTIVDTINSAIDASGLTLPSLEGALTGIDVNSSGELVLSWSGGSATLDADAVLDKVQNVMDSLVDEAKDYLTDGNPAKWDLQVGIVGSALTLGAQATIFGITASVTDLDITFGDMAASFSDATVSLGSKTATFFGSADISCTDYVPGLTVTGLSAGDEYPGLRDLVADYETALCDALSTLASNVIDDTGLTCPVCFNNIGIVSGNLKLWLDGLGGGAPGPEEEEAAAAGLLALPEPANFAASYMKVSPQQVLPGQEVQISINIANHGGESGAHNVALFINGYVEQSQTVSVSPGATRLVVFRTSKTVPGTYQVSIEGAKGQFIVLDISESTAQPAATGGGGLGTAGIVTIVIIVLALIVAMVFIFRPTSRP